VFSNPNQKVLVGLSRLIYDSELFNLGENTGTYFEVMIDGRYFKVEIENTHVQNPEDAKKAIEKALGKVVVKRKRGEEKMTKETLAEHITLHVDKGRIQIELTDIHDFGISPMLRKMLGIHREKKFFSENFQFRKKCRDFLTEISDDNEIYSKMDRLEGIFDRTIFKSTKFADRNKQLLPFNLPIQQFFHQLNEDFVFVLQSIVKQRVSGFKDFVSVNYYPSTRDDSYTLEVEESPNQPISSIEVPFEVTSMIDYVIFTCVNESSRIPANKHFKVKGDALFNPDLFSVLFVYSNIIKPVSFNDGTFRLLDVVCLNKMQLSSSGVSEHKSTLFKELDVTTIDEIEFQINTPLGFPAPFIHGPVFVILEFKTSPK
jgi:hypothetical protein